jgi:hypothetical protein
LLADITAYGLAKTVGEYLASRNVENAMQTVFSDGVEQVVPAEQDNQKASDSPESTKPSQSQSTRACTALQWLQKLGLEWGTVHEVFMWMVMSKRM